MSVKIDRFKEALGLVLDEDQEFPVRRLQILLTISEKQPINSSDL